MTIFEKTVSERQDKPARNAPAPYDISGARIINAEFKAKLPQGKIVSLLRAIEHPHSAKEAPVILFTSAYSGEGTDIIALETAYAAAVSTHKKVLFVDCSEGKKRIKVRVGKRDVPLSVDRTLLQSPSPEKSPFNVFDGTTLYYSRLTEGEKSRSLNFMSCKAKFARLKEIFDLIIISSESSLAGSSSIFSALADSTIIVVEAERTRIPVVKRLKETIEAGGGTVSGAVLSRQRYYIPGWLYFLLFRKR